MKTIIALTDFSENSLNAVNYAADMACLIRARLTIMNVVPLPMSGAEVPVPAYNFQDLDDDAQEELKLLKQKIEERTNGHIIVHAEIRPGNLLPMLKDYCEMVKPFAVVMGEESAGALERTLLGGAAVSALRDIYWPVIFVPFNATFEGIKKIGLACDLKKVHETVHVEPIKAFVKEFDAELHVVNISDNGQNAFDDKAVLESMILQEMLGELNPKYHFISSKDTDTAIQKFVVEKDMDMLMLIPKKHLFPGTMFKARHSKELLLEAEVPILSIHA
ncbi:universal stress protein [Danxiaibacter flavus]|uniref:Universal stress protein n=1 Tax=Danxiaibacter flavus TaxID=3049108 RepID=A0ABV3ZN08_9BACT|nr:universal stress protein [Chitinophagaceae bacterium DXS]